MVSWRVHFFNFQPGWFPGRLSFLVRVVVVLLPPALVLRGLQQDDVIVVLAALAVAVVVHVEERVGVHAADVHGQLAHSTLERKTTLDICLVQ